MCAAMDAKLQDRRGLLPVLPLPQVVPSHECFHCDVCCRFPEADSFLRPYFTAEEIDRAVARGVAPGSFPERRGSQVALVPNPQGDGYLCPAFDPATSHCRIYDARPLDCQIYPLALMWSADGSQVLLGWDSKCPFLRERGGDPVALADLQAYAERIAGLVEGPATLDVLTEHRRLIGRFQDDVVVLRPLLRLTGRLLEARKAESGTKTEGGPEPAAAPRPSAAPGPLSLRPLALSDRAAFEAACALCDSPLAHYAFAPHYIWRGLLDYAWAEVSGHLCLFAASPDGLFMPLPPLPQVRSSGGWRAELGEAVQQAFARMRKANGESPVSRIENIPETVACMLADQGYVVTFKGSDYLYQTSDLVRLAGDRYKSPRAACNRFVREHRAQYEPYRDEDREACLALYRVWMAQQEARPLDDLARHMLRDSASAHREVLTEHAALGLVGRVVRVGGAVCAYTFGYGRSGAVFCVLLEVADRTMPGLAAFLFREFCREAETRGYACINSMDDAGLSALAGAKLTYRPVRLIPSYLATE